METRIYNSKTSAARVAIIEPSRLREGFDVWVEDFPSECIRPFTSGNFPTMRQAASHARRALRW